MKTVWSKGSSLVNNLTFQIIFHLLIKWSDLVFLRMSNNILAYIKAAFLYNSFLCRKSIWKIHFMYTHFSTCILNTKKLEFCELVSKFTIGIPLPMQMMYLVSFVLISWSPNTPPHSHICALHWDIILHLVVVRA